MMQKSPWRDVVYGFFPYLALADIAGNAMGVKDFNDIGNKVGGGVSDLWKGLTGQTSAEATIYANERNIQNQNYWNTIAMQREDSAHQREIADLQAAGLNPWLSAGGGAQASSMSTATAEPEDGSKILQATSAAVLLAAIKLLATKGKAK